MWNFKFPNLFKREIIVKYNLMISNNRDKIDIW